MVIFPLTSFGVSLYRKKDLLEMSVFHWKQAGYKSKPEAEADI